MRNKVKMEDDSRAQINPETPGRDDRDEYISDVSIYEHRCLLTISTRHGQREHPQGEAQPGLGWKSVRNQGKIRIAKYKPCNAPSRAEKADIFATTLGSEHVNGCNT